MKDFFDDLERQLVAATPQRQARLRRARGRRAAANASMLVVLLAGGAGIAVAVGGDEQDGAGAPAGRGGGAATTSAPATTSPTAAPPERSAYTVSVLNGTAVPGLARGVANQLQNDHFKIGNVTNAPRQDRTDTVVYYRSPDCIPAASEVASALRLGDAQGEFSLRPVTRALKVRAGDQAKVVVVVGSDQNTQLGP
jgi:hypothetical protein